jgi:hypothetical protein
VAATNRAGSLAHLGASVFSEQVLETDLLFASSASLEAKTLSSAAVTASARSPAKHVQYFESGSADNLGLACWQTCIISAMNEYPIGFRDEAIELLLVPYKIRALHCAGKWTNRFGEVKRCRR